MMDCGFRRSLPIALLLLVTACGGGGGGSGQPPGSNPTTPPPSGSPPPPAPTTPTTPDPPPPPPPAVDPSYVKLSSDGGDYIGAGQNYVYSKADAQIAVVADGARLTISVTGDEQWAGEFQLPDAYSELQPGSYGGLGRYPFHDPAVGGLDWFGEGRGCNTLTGWLIIDSVTYDEAILTGIDLRFEQHCEGGAPALHGEIHWDVNDATVPPGPAVSPPADLWTPVDGVTPATGNYVYLESLPGDYIGGGGTYQYTEADSLITVNAADGRVSVSINGNEAWNGDFQGMHTLSQLEAGYYGDLRRYPFHNPVKGGLSWSGEGRGCNRLTGWFVVDNVTYDGSTLNAIDLRFEQHCEGGTSALRGKIHWDVNDTTNPPGPVVPPPTDLWEPDDGVTPVTGNYVYLESQPGDYIGSSGTYLYTQATSVITVNAESGLVSVSISGDERWGGEFRAMHTLSRLEVGYYGDLQRFPFHNPVKGGLSWSGEGRGCNTLSGWFVVDSVTYDGSTLNAIDLRFEQHCEGGTPALRGEIHWDANDTTSPPGPVLPPPTDLWEPADGVTPATGNYVYLESDPSDYIGSGGTYLYTQATSVITVNAGIGLVSVSVSGDQQWDGEFQGMNTLSQLEAGYYGDLRRFPFHNPVKGGLSWTGQGHGCNMLSGWFVVDSVTYQGSTLNAIDLRFEQHCESGTAALRGEIHWDINDTTSPPGPVLPPPADLWEPADGVTPAVGNYVYLESDPSDYIGSGGTYLYTETDSVITVEAVSNRVSVSIGSDDGTWFGGFEGMSTLTRLEAGYYGDLRDYPHNPVKGRLNWSGHGRGCSGTGWFVVDSVTYDGSTLRAIDLRFAQHCEGGTSALHGEIHWSQ